MPTLDKFYTNEGEAKRCIGITIDTIGGSNWEWCEPSAGGGVSILIYHALRLGMIYFQSAKE